MGFLATQVSLVSAHGAEGHSPITKWHGLLVLFVGILVAIGVVAAKRTEWLSPTHALAGVLAGVALAGLGAILFEGLSPDPTFTAETMPYPRTWYTPIAVVVGLFTIITSLVVGIARWPSRPRYTYLGILTGAWILYPELLPEPSRSTHPVGYLIVLGTPILVGYIVWKDAWGVLRTIFGDPVVRRFGIGIAVVVFVFFMTMTGYLSFFWEEGAPRETTVVVLPVVYQLVLWPTLEIAIPQIPVFLALSPAFIILNGMIGVLVGLNAAMIARQWRIEERAGMTEGAAGTAAILGSCTCGCCGPLVAKFAVVAAGPTIAAPLYWLFADPASPLDVLFVVGSIVLFTGTLVSSAETASEQNQSLCAVEAN